MEQETEMLQDGELGQKLNALLSDPERLGQLAGMAQSLASSGALSGLLGGLGGAPQTESTSAAQEDDVERSVTAAEDSRPVPRAGTAHGMSGRHAALLRALKPYLGEEKQARVEQMMKLLQLAELADTVLRGGN